MKNLKNKTLDLLKNNTDQYNILKCIEELNELSTILTQSLTKPNKIDDKDIVKEIGDVKIRLWYLIDKFGEYPVRERIINKLIDINKYANNRRRS